MGYSRKLMGESSEVFVPSKNDRSRLPLYRATWVEPLATRTFAYSHFVFLTCALCLGVNESFLEGRANCNLTATDAQASSPASIAHTSVSRIGGQWAACGRYRRSDDGRRS